MSMCVCVLKKKLRMYRNDFFLTPGKKLFFEKEGSMGIQLDVLIHYILLRGEIEENMAKC